MMKQAPIPIISEKMKVIVVIAHANILLIKKKKKKEGTKKQQHKSNKNCINKSTQAVLLI